MIQRFLIYVAMLLGLIGTCKWSFAAGQETLTAVTKKSTGDYITTIRDGFNTELAKQQRMNTELYAADALKTNTSCFGSEAAFNACFPLDWPTGFDVSADYTVTGLWDFTGATVTGISGVNYTAGNDISISGNTISLSWDKDYADLINAPEFIDFSATSPLNFNPTTGVLSLTPWESQSALETWLGWTFSGGGGGITVSSTLPTTAGSAALNDSTHVLTVASDTGYTSFTGSFTAWDTTPAAFGFGTITNAVAGQEYCWTTPVTVADINRPSTVSSTADSYKINETTSTATSISLGDTFTPCMVASSTAGATVSGNVTVGGVAGDPVFSVTTGGADPEINEIGTRSIGTTNTDFLSGSVRAQRVQADASGNLHTAYYYITAAGSSSSVILCVYNSTNSVLTSDTGATLVGCSGTIDSLATPGFSSASMAGTYNVILGNYYWLVQINNGPYTWQSTRANSGDTIYTRSDASTTFATAPATLPTSGWTGPTASGAYSAYISIGN